MGVSVSRVTGAPPGRAGRCAVGGGVGSASNCRLALSEARVQGSVSHLLLKLDGEGERGVLHRREAIAALDPHSATLEFVGDGRRAGCRIDHPRPGLKGIANRATLGARTWRGGCARWGE